MLIDIKKILTPDDLKSNFEEVCERLKMENEVYIFQNNKPTHVLMTIEQYQVYIDANEVGNSDFQDDNGNESLEVLLNKIGKRVFVEYYYVFKEDKNPEERLSETEFTLNSRRSRSSSARKIFRDGMELDALNSIIKSSRLDDGIVDKAKEILATEIGVVSISKVNLDDEAESDLKIGKMVKVLITRFIQDGLLSKAEIQSMINTDYSKEVFNLNFSVLKKVDKSINVDLQKKDQNGYNRYYGDLVAKEGEQYLICSQWVENLHKTFFEKWLKNKLNDILIKQVNELSSGTEFTVKGLLDDYWTYVPYSIRKSLGKDFFNQVHSDKDIEILEKRNNVQVYRKH